MPVIAELRNDIKKYIKRHELSKISCSIHMLA